MKTTILLSIMIATLANYAFACSNPTNLQAISTRDGGTWLTWTEVSGATLYTVRIFNSNNVKVKDTTFAPFRDSKYVVHPKQFPNGVYHWKVRATCGGSQSKFVNGPNFSIPSTRLGDNGLNETKPIGIQNIFPNPSSGKVAVQYNSINGGEVELQVRDLTGRVMSHQTITAGEGSNTLNLNFDLLPGIYFLEMKEGAARTQAKFMIQK